MMRNIALLAAVVGLIAAYTWYDGRATQTPIAIQTETAPDFTFTALDGTEHTLSEFKGKAIVLNFWATWCAPCVVEFPQMVALAEATKAHSVFVFVSQDEREDDVRRFLKKYAAKTPANVFIARDANKKIAKDLYQTYKLPETYLIDGGFQIRRKIIGNTGDWDGQTIRQEIQRIAAP